MKIANVSICTRCIKHCLVVVPASKLAVNGLVAKSRQRTLLVASRKNLADRIRPDSSLASAKVAGIDRLEDMI